GGGLRLKLRLLAGVRLLRGRRLAAPADPSLVARSRGAVLRRLSDAADRVVPQAALDSRRPGAAPCGLVCRQRRPRPAPPGRKLLPAAGEVLGAAARRRARVRRDERGSAPNPATVARRRDRARHLAARSRLLRSDERKRV